MIEPARTASSRLNRSGIYRPTAAAEPARQMANPVIEIRRGVWAARA
jgi:hypothetical protein